MNLETAIKAKSRHRRKQQLIFLKDNAIQFLGERSAVKTRQPRHEPHSELLADRKRNRHTQIIHKDSISAEAQRANSIAAKILFGTDDTKFSEAEEADIFDRVSKYLKSMIPDPRYCLPPDQVFPPVSSLLSSDKSTAGEDEKSQNTWNAVTVSQNDLFMSRECELLPTFAPGTRLIKPTKKLVELVALAIDKSPDGILQVQQVYSYLMKRYPYFAYMDKLSTNSWRSSIRHALYQKWFRKIPISDEKMSSKGCFWALNRRNQPKEWSLPAVCSPVQPDYDCLMSCSKSESYDIRSGSTPHIGCPTCIQEVMYKSRLYPAGVKPIYQPSPLQPTYQVAGMTYLPLQQWNYAHIIGKENIDIQRGYVTGSVACSSDQWNYTTMTGSVNPQNDSWYS